MKPHATFKDINPDTDIANALTDLYEHPDMVELYPGLFCESNGRNMDPGTEGTGGLAMWTGVFSDAVTLVRSDRFYTVVSLQHPIFLFYFSLKSLLLARIGLDRHILDRVGNERSLVQQQSPERFHVLQANSKSISRMVQIRLDLSLAADVHSDCQQKVCRQTEAT